MTRFDNSFARALEGVYTPWAGAVAPAPQLVKFNAALAEELGLDPADWSAAVLSGSDAPEGASPIAQAYAGHQFGGYSPQLGDGRALLLGEVIDRAGQRRDIALKGSGRTPYSRGGDGKAVIGPVLREYLVGEAMHAMGVPTTRALAAVTTGETVLRDAGPLPGAVLTRVAASHLRVGTFQYVASFGDVDRLRRLLTYAIDRHYPDLAESEAPALTFLAAVRDRQARLIARWMGLGFVHGVMNTDNMTLSGETIDYGPCAFMDTYDEAALFSSIDRGGRYAYGNQPAIGQWNLARLAEALLPVIDPDMDRAVELAVPVISDYAGVYEAAWTDVFRAKLGLPDKADGDRALIEGLLAAMQGRSDFTRTFCALAREVRAPGSFPADNSALKAWLPAWRARLGDGAAEAADKMDAVNPIYIPRNHLVEEALSAAEAGDYAPFERFLTVLSRPFVEQEGAETHALPAPSDFGKYTTFCGT